MIPEHNKTLFLDHIAAGKTFQEACEASHISVPSMYRFMKEDPILKKKYDDTVFELKEKARTKSNTANMAALKALIVKKKY